MCAHTHMHTHMCACNNFKAAEPLCAQSCVTLCDPVDGSPPGSSLHGIFQARILECIAISYSRGSSQVRDQTRVSSVSCPGRLILYLGATWKALFSIPFPNTVAVCSLAGDTIRKQISMKLPMLLQFSSVQSLSHVQLFATP